MSSWAEYLTKGAPLPPSGKVPLRQDVRDLKPEQKYLYLEGLKLFHDVPKDDPLSYFKISGIHGLPFETWPNKDFNKGVIPKRYTEGEFGGFCTHSSILFLTWHRPYLALFEAALYTHVQEVAKKIDASHPEKATYKAYAESFRIPYWDWARKDTQVVPAEALNPNYHAPGPPGSKIASASDKDDYNPLFLYKFPEGTSPEITKKDRNLKPYKNTVRYPNSQGKDDNILDKMTLFYNEPGSSGRVPAFNPERNLSERTAYILQSYSTFAAVSKNSMRLHPGGATDDAPNWGSLEDIHNVVHILTGGAGKEGQSKLPAREGGGHMYYVPNSAFDPIFWLHHTNIDRLFAIWQALHEDDTDSEAFVTPRGAGMGNYSVRPKEEEDKDTPLYPFRPDVDSWYLSEDVKRTELFKYTYKEIEGLAYPTPQKDRERITADIANQYGPPWSFIQASKLGEETAGEELLTRSHIQRSLTDNRIPATAGNAESLIADLPSSQTLLEDSLGPSKPFLRDLAPNNKYLEWITNIKAEKHTLDGAYTVHVFLGAANDETNVGLWPAAPTHVGTFAPLGQSSDTGCGKCQGDQGDHLQVTGQIPLTVALMERYLGGLVADLKVESVVPYLKTNLHWRVAKPDGTIVTNQADVDGLKIFVLSNEVTIASDYKGLPVYDTDVKIYPEITTNREGDGRGHGTGLIEAEAPAESVP